MLTDPTSDHMDPPARREGSQPRARIPAVGLLASAPPEPSWRRSLTVCA